MFPLQNTLAKNIVAQTSTATNATASGLVDTLGFDSVSVQVFLDSQAATSSNPATLKLQECDTSNGTFADITGLVGDATDGFTIPVADAANPQVLQLHVDMRHRKRYLKLLVTPAGTAQVVGATAVLGKAEQTPASSTIGAVLASA